MITNCATPETTDYETLGIYVPGDYFTGTKNSDGTYTCTINENGKVGNYTSATAPIVIPVNTPGYSAQHSPSSYSSNDISTYLNEGFIYVYAGCRGRYESETDYISGAPWGVTDLKAAIRYLRYNASSIPADTGKIFTFGMSGGGAQSAIVGAFDDLSKSQAENKVFGNSSSTSLHFDSIMANLLKTNSSKYSSLSNWDSSYVTSYTEDLSNTDSLGKTVEYRANMYNPMYYLSSYYDGYGTSTVAKYWRINTGITQGDTANVTEINLALALQNNSNVKDVDFTTVWGQGHTQAERTGSSTTNFINWVNECLK